MAKTFVGKLLKGLSGGLPGAILSGASSLLTNRGARRRQQLADDNNIKFWNMQNEYNDPSQQMARLKKAGLNPALIYGSGATNTGVAGSIAPSKPSPYNIKDPTPSALDTMIKGAQVGNIQEDTRAKKIDNDYREENNPEKLKVQKEKAIQEAINTSVLTSTQKARVTSLLQKAVQDQYNTKNVKSKTQYEIELRNMGIDPNGSTGNNILKALLLGAGSIYNNFLKNPQEITRTPNR
jgi:hypothetical protein